VKEERERSQKDVGDLAGGSKIPVIAPPSGREGDRMTKRKRKRWFLVRVLGSNEKVYREEFTKRSRGISIRENGILGGSRGVPGHKEGRPILLDKDGWGNESASGPDGVLDLGKTEATLSSLPVAVDRKRKSRGSFP